MSSAGVVCSMLRTGPSECSVYVVSIAVPEQAARAVVFNLPNTMTL